MRSTRHVAANVAAAEAGPLDAELIERFAHTMNREPTSWSQ